MRLAHVPGVVPEPLARDLEGQGARAPGRMGAEHSPGLSPPHRAAVRLETPEPARVVDDLSGASELVGRPADRVADAEHEAEQAEHGDEGRRAHEGAHDVAAAALDEPRGRDEGHEQDDGCRACDDEEAERGTVGDAVGVGTAVLDERGPRERPRADDHGGKGGEQAEQSSLETALGEHEGERHDRDPGEHARSGLGQQDDEGGAEEEQRTRRPAEPPPDRDDEPEAESERRIREERERVPVADRPLQPRHAARIVRPDPRNHLPDERPREHPTERPGEDERQRPQGTSREGRGCEADDAEGQHDDSLRERVPGAVTGDRPPDRQARPRYETRCRDCRREPRLVETRKWQCPERPGDEDARRDDHRGRSERRGAVRSGGAAVEQGPGEEHSDGHLDGTAHAPPHPA